MRKFKRLLKFKIVEARVILVIDSATVHENSFIQIVLEIH
jgi:hypothetical protein